MAVERITDIDRNNVVSVIDMHMDRSVLKVAY